MNLPSININAQKKVPAPPTEPIKKLVKLPEELQLKHPDLLVTEISDDSDMSTEDEDEGYLSQIDLQEHIKEFAACYGQAATKAIIGISLAALIDSKKQKK